MCGEQQEQIGNIRKHNVKISNMYIHMDEYKKKMRKKLFKSLHEVKYVEFSLKKGEKYYFYSDY